MDDKRLTDKEHRINYLVLNLGLKPSDALRQIESTEPTLGELFYIASERIKLAGIVMAKAFGLIK